MALSPAVFRQICINAHQAAVESTRNQPQEPSRTFGEAASLRLHLEDYRELVLWLVNEREVAPQIFCFVQQSGVIDVKLTDLFSLSLAAQHMGCKAALQVFNEFGISGEIKDCFFEIMPSTDQY